MAAQHSRLGPRDFVFEPTPAVAASRARSRYVSCSVCGTDNSEYLFHRVGVRFVRCRTCGLVYVNPVGEAGRSYFDVASFGQHNEHDQRNLVRDFSTLLDQVTRGFAKENGRAPKKTVLLGRWLDAFADTNEAKAATLEIVHVGDEEFATLVDGDVRPFAQRVAAMSPELVILDDFLEATGDPAAVLDALTAALGDDVWYAIGYANVQSMPARVLRRYWPRFFEHKRSYFSTSNLVALMSRYGFAMKSQFAHPSHVTTGYALSRALPTQAPLHALARPIEGLTFPAFTGNRVALFKKRRETNRAEKLSIVFPCFNEARYVAQVIETILAKPLPIERELVIVESNSTDGTRDIVKQFEGRPGVRVLLEERPRGKGHAVRTGLAAVTGSIILIQDADFEYDIEDYDALLAPILQNRTSFVLGSRSLGLDDWKVRRFEGTPLKRLVLNAAQVGFAVTFNALYQQSTTDVNTMFKVFRTECLDGIDLEGDRFTLDIELVCKLVKNGYAPLEVPVNYVARGFEEGKKISFVKDALPSYFAFFKYRFGS
jgi:hypothetical protein